MKFEFENGKHLGTAEWQGPGRVAVEMDDPEQRDWFERYFSSEDSFMGGSVEADGDMRCERRDESAEAFERAARMLAAYSYKVRQGDAARHETYGARS
ncbi:MAG: hypothetical protein ACRDLB_03755 [Actinomycetota bacterium]